MANYNEADKFFNNSDNTDEYNSDLNHQENMPNKKWGIFGIVLIILWIGIIIYTFGFSRNKNKATIETDCPLNYVGYSYSELSELNFYVKSIGRKDNSKDTNWYLNDELLVSSTNNTMLDMNRLAFGENYLIAKNGDTEIIFMILLNKNNSGDDETHKIISLLYKYPDSFFEPEPTYKEFDRETYIKSVEGSSNIKEYNEGLLRTVQIFNDVELYTFEYSPYNLEISKVKDIPNNFISDRSAYISGSWEEVDDAYIKVNLKYEIEDTITVLRIYNNEIYEIPQDKINYFSSYAEIHIEDNGNYLVFSNNFKYNNIIDYNIIAIKNSNKLVKANDPDAENGDPRFVNTVNGVDDEILEIVNYIENKANSDIDNFAELKVYKYQLGYKTFVSYIDLINEVYSRSLNNIDSKYIILLDLRGEEYFTNLQLLRTINDYSAGFDELNLIIFTDYIGDTNSMVSWNENINVYMFTSLDELTDSVINKINNNISKGSKSQITINGQTIEVLKLADSGFKVGYNSINSELTTNSELNGGNAFGFALLSQLIYTDELNDSILNNIKIHNSIKPGVVGDFILNLKLNDNRPNASISQAILNTIKTNGLYNCEDSLSFSINALSVCFINNTDSNIVNANSLGSRFIDKIFNELNNGKPMMMNIKSDKGSTTVLVTALYQDSNNENTYYFELYDPIYPNETRYAMLTATKALNSYNMITLDYRFSYYDSSILFDKAGLYKNISIYNGDNIVFERSID